MVRPIESKILRLKAYRFQLQPDAAQAASLLDWSHALRFLWNWMLAQRRDAFKASEGRVRVSYHEQAAQLPPMKEVFPWLSLLPSQALQQTLLNLDQAFVNFFEGRARYPDFKRRSGSPPGIRWPQGVELNGRCVWLPKLGWVKARISRPVEGTIRNATVRFDGLRWQVSIQVEQEVGVPARSEAPWVGIDLGVVESLATSDGRLFRLPVATREEERRHSLLCRRVSRCVPGSRRHANAKRRRLVFVRRIRNRVDDARHKLTTTLAKNHGHIVAEGLALRLLSRSARGSVDLPGKNVAARAGLNRALLGQGHSETARQLGYKLGWCGGELIKVDPAFTSQTCPQCGHVCPENRPVRDRFTCVVCGHRGHADNVAAMNILAAGQAVSARGGPQGPAKREPTRLRRFLRRSAGIPAL
ncbi:MAG TPA: transposase [Bryobacteraceae bacterium]|nr:transposase [Bryobacteraceae bacterium]